MIGHDQGWAIQRAEITEPVDLYGQLLAHHILDRQPPGHPRVARAPVPSVPSRSVSLGRPFLI